ncbi:MAG TPA: hypothetical protein PLA73_01330 [Sedimentibacter sp.]|nr:hypothetical protein [Sedimentibacter sp.]
MREIKILSNLFGGYDNEKFLSVIWNMNIDELKTLLKESQNDLKWLKSNFYGTLRVFYIKDAQWVKTRIKLIKEVIAYKSYP